MSVDVNHQLMAHGPSIRTVVNKRKRLWMVVFWFGVVLLVVMPLFRLAGPLAWLPLIGLGFCVAAVTAINLSIRCPKCRNNLGVIAAMSGDTLSISKKIRFCPYCGADFDENIQQGAEG